MTKKIFILLLVSVFSVSCTSDNSENAATDAINYLALGDSYTIGQGVEPVKRWPSQLMTQLIQSDYRVNNLKVIAKTGWTTTDLLNAIAEENTEGYNLVSLLIGVNNQFRNQSLEEFKPQFDEVLQKAIDLSGQDRRIFVVSIPDYSVTPFGSRNPDTPMEIDEYNSYMQQQCLEFDIPFVDVTEISRTLGDSEGALAEDNLHPSASQYSSWVEEILPVVIEMLSE